MPSKAAPRLDAIKLDRLVVEYVPIDSIKPNTYNPNRQAEHEFQLLIKSMEEDGFTQPVIVLRRNSEIVDGEHRWRAAHALGYEEVPVVFVDMTPEQMRVATLRHNRARGSEDTELAAVVLSDLKKLLGDSSQIAQELGLSVSEIDQLVADFSDPQVLEAPEVVEAEASGDTAAIQEARRAAAARLEGIKADDRAAALANDLDTYRVILVVTNEEAEVVRSVLEPAPAERLLAMCKEELNGAA